MDALDQVRVQLAASNRCDLCAFWMPLTDDKGECHRHAPGTVQQLPMQGTGASDIPHQSPLTTAAFWCGDHWDGQGQPL